jgi:hypothetical protein
MSELYTTMMRGSPVQKEWKLKSGDMTDYGRVWNALYGRYDANLKHVDDGSVWLLIDKMEINKDKATWLPTQEDWQRILDNTDVGVPFASQLSKWFNKEFPDVESDYNAKPRALRDDIDRWNLIWCLFTHKEVYGLTWDWEENKWKSK